MQRHSFGKDGFVDQKGERSPGFTVVDLAAYLFVVGLVILSLPLFWQPSAASTSSNHYRSRAVLPVRLVLER